jgi:hypothetical protein
MVKSLIRLVCSADKGTYIGIDKGSLDIHLIFDQMPAGPVDDPDGEPTCSSLIVIHFDGKVTVVHYFFDCNMTKQLIIQQDSCSCDPLAALTLPA